MNILLFGATGMVGQGVLQEFLGDARVAQVQAIGRTAVGITHPKFREVVHTDLHEYASIESQLSGFDACFFCLGISSFRMKQPEYERITYGITMAAAQTLVRLNPGMTFVYVTGSGTDSSEQGRSMWGRVKGKTENALLRLPFKAAFMFRPGAIQPLKGIRSKTKVYRLAGAILNPLFPVVRWAFPNLILTTAEVGQAMIGVATHGYAKPILEIKDIRAAAEQSKTVQEATHST